MASTRTTTIAGWILAALLAAAYAFAALGKLSGAAAPMFEGWGYPGWFATLIGVVELAGAIGLLVPRLTRLAILGLSGVMLGAVYTHLSNAEGPEVARPLIFLALLWLLWWLRRPGAAGAPDAAGG